MSASLLPQPAVVRNADLADEPLIVVQLPSANDVRLLGLRERVFGICPASHTDAFGSWEIGIMSLGEFVPLLKI
jgi:hypothetical protein